MKHMINNNNNNNSTLLLFNPKAMEKTPLLPKRVSSSISPHSSTTTSPSNTSSRSLATTETDFSEENNIDNNNFHHKSSKSSPISSILFPTEDALSYKPLAVLSGHAGTVSCLAVCGEFLLSASQAKDIIVWQQPDLKPFAKFGHGDGSVKALVALNNRVFTAHQDSRIRVWKLSRSRASENAFRLVNTLPTTKDYLGKCMIQRNYVQTRRHHKKLWIEHADSISCLAVSDGLVYSGSWDKTVKVWRASDLKCLESIEAHDDAVNAVVNGERGGIVYSASADGKIKAWKRESSSSNGRGHALKAILEGHKDVSVNAVVVSGDGKWVFGAGSDGYVMVWERKVIRMDGCDDDNDERWDLVFEVRAHKMAVLSLCLVGEFLCSGSADKTVGIWKRKGFGRLCKVGQVLGHQGPVKCLQALTSGVGLGSGFLLYSGGLDRTLRVWWVPTKSDTSSIEL